MSQEPMNDESLPKFANEWAALYVAGAMTNEERGEFEARLEDDSVLREAMRSFSEVEDALLEGIEPISPDPKTRQQLLARVEEESRETSAPPPLICRASDDDWLEAGVPGVSLRILHADLQTKRMTALMRMEAGAVYPSHVHDQAEECLMLEGDLDFGEYVLQAGDYLRLEPGTQHGEARTKNGCVCLVTSELPDFLVA